MLDEPVDDHVDVDRVLAGDHVAADLPAFDGAQASEIPKGAAKGFQRLLFIY